MGTVKNESEAKNSKGQYFRGDQGSGMDRARDEKWTGQKSKGEENRDKVWEFRWSAKAEWNRIIGSIK